MTAPVSQPSPQPAARIEWFGRLEVHQPVKENPVSDCTACEHPVIIPEHLKATVTEIHICENEAA